jgi:hypothetical protein
MRKNKLVVNVYALDTTRTAADHVSRQGFGVSTRLDKPITSTTYHWQMRPESGGLGASNARSSIEALAANLSDNIRSGFGTKYPMDNSVVEVRLSPSRQILEQETTTDPSQSRRPRALSDREAAAFRGAYQAAEKERTAQMPEATAISTPDPARRAQFQKRDPDKGLDR